ncbi:ABC transporter ATP-binding protein [Halogranum amylolyticum]|nr:ABC transporter ATP-binding protein [Halogranum amylolyticum]
MSTLQIDSLVKTFTAADSSNDIVAVDNLDITAEEGEFLVLLGPSGCGKSTTLRCIAGLETPTSGSIRLGSREITDLTPQDRDMAMVFQDFALYPHMTAAENMSFGLKMTTDLSKAEREERVQHAAEIMDIEEILDNKPGQVSGGQKQRIALGRAIVRDPDVFLMDEPLSNLDAKLRAQMRTEIQRLHRQIDVTTIYVTHDQTEAMTMSDRIVVMNDGVLQQIGTPDYVYKHPTNQFVAGFIGEPSMNFLQTTVSSVDGTYRLTTDTDTSFSYPLEEQVVERCDLSEGDSVTIGVRPESIRVVPTDSDQPAYTQTAVVDVVEPMGSDNFLYLLIGDTSWTARVDGDVDPDDGETISYAFDPADLHLFLPDGTTVKSSGVDDDAYHSSSDDQTTEPSQPLNTEA